jgi:transposase
MKKKVSSESVVKDIRSRTRKKYSSEEKIQIVLEGHRGEESIAEEYKAEILTIKKGLEAFCL